MIMGLSHLHMGPRISGPMSTTTRPIGITLAVLVRELPVEDGCTSTKHIMVLGFLPYLIMSTCGSTAPLGDGPGPSLEQVTALARIGGPALALTPREHLLIMLRGDHARPLPLKPALRHLLLLLRRRRHRSARRRATGPLTASATTAGPEPSIRSVALAPTAPTAAFVCARRRASTP